MTRVTKRKAKAREPFEEAVVTVPGPFVPNKELIRESLERFPSVMVEDPLGRIAQDQALIAENARRLHEHAEAAGREPLTHVAIRFEGRVWSLPRPYRHHHIIRVITYLDRTVDRVDASGEDQGFLDARGRYLTRDQAKPVAEQFGQIKGGKIIGGVLTSEDLW